MMRRYLGLVVLFVCLAPFSASAQELVEDTVSVRRAEVIEVISAETRPIPGTDTPAEYQTIRVEILSGAEAGQEVVVKNDYLQLEPGDMFYLTHTTSALDGTDYYAVGEPYRLPALSILVALFILVTLIFGGLQGLRGLLALVASLLGVFFILLPAVTAGYSPVWVSIGVASLIVIFGSYVTHGFNRMTTTAVLGMITTILATGGLASVAIATAHLSGFSADEAVYLNLNSRGSIDMAGLLLGAILIGLLGVLYDAAIGQSVAVEELTAANPVSSRRHILTRALRIGREHIGALVNTLAIAYVGAALPLLLLFYGAGSTDIGMLVNREIFAVEIVRILIGSIGVILVVPVTTLLATLLLVGRGSGQLINSAGHHHSH